MTKIIELANALGTEIAKSDEIKNLEAAKAAFESNAELSEKMKEDEAKVLFYPELSSAKAAKSVANETGARLLMLHSCHNLTDEEISSGENYLSLMTKNLENIKEALS